MIEILLILTLGLIPLILSLWITQRAETQARERFKAVMAATTTIRLQTTWLPLDADPAVGGSWMVGDVSCRFNARSAYLRCAVNPSGPCQACSDYEQKLSHN